MIWAQWGLKDKLIYNPSVWLCHQCGDCSTNCPRGARPSDVLSAVRSISYNQLAIPDFLGKMLSSPSYLLPLFAVPIAVLLLVVMNYHGLTIPEGEIIYSKLLPIWLIDSIFLPVALFAVITAILGIRKLWMGMRKNYPIEGSVNIISSLVETVKDILLHRKFSLCETNKPLKWNHMLTFYGFIALFITTNFVLIYHYLFAKETPLALLDPVKVLGNAGAVAALVGVGWIILRRLASEEDAGKAFYYDWTFILALFFTILTGIGAELVRLAEIASVAYPVYFIHLVLVFFLFAYMPFSKFAHILYRTTAMVFSNAVENIKKNREV